MMTVAAVCSVENNAGILINHVKETENSLMNVYFVVLTLHRACSIDIYRLFCIAKRFNPLLHVVTLT